jgi:hypothetical protein
VNHSGRTCIIFRPFSGGLFTKLCRAFQKLADRSYGKRKTEDFGPKLSLADQRGFPAVRMGKSDSTQGEVTRRMTFLSLLDLENSGADSSDYVTYIISIMT